MTRAYLFGAKRITCLPGSIALLSSSLKKKNSILVLNVTSFIEVGRT